MFSSRFFAFILLFLVYLPILWFGLYKETNSVLTFLSYAIIGLYLFGSLMISFVGMNVTSILNNALKENPKRIIEAASKPNLMTFTIPYAIIATYIIFISDMPTLAAIFATASIAFVYYIFKIERAFWYAMIKIKGETKE